jgi:anti-sigma factor RsiW
MSKCPSLRHYYADYYDAALPPRERSHVEAHMRACAGCFEDYRAYTGTCELLHELPRETAPFGFADRVRFALRQEEDARSSRGDAWAWLARPSWNRLAPAFGTAAVLAAAALVLWRAPALDPHREAAPGAPAPSLAAVPVSADEIVPAHEVAEKIAEIEALVEDINVLTAQAEAPIFLGADTEHELVFDPNAIYRRPGQAPVGAASASHSSPSRP